jgi:uncharacterized membrane protein SpoIIM required for sporulation
LSGYLNDVVGRAYALTYPGKRVRPSEVWRFLVHGFPQLMTREWRMVLTALVVFWAGFGFGWLGMAFDPEAAPYLVPDQHQMLDPVKRAEQEASGVGATTQEQSAFASFLFTHNIQVAFFAFALGLTAGVGTVIMLFANGVLLGALAWIYASKGMLAWFWAWILPHGLPEITAICIAGAAGLVLARGLVAPQGESRRRAVRREAQTAVRLVLGTLALFVLAGLIEGTISQIHPPKLSIAFKLGFAAVVGLGVYAYLFSPALLPRLKAARVEATS